MNGETMEDFERDVRKVVSNYADELDMGEMAQFLQNLTYEMIDEDFQEEVRWYD